MSEQKLLLKDWDRVQVAWQVARLGTLSAAAAALGMHHATVIRHIDALEDALGARLFHRHPRGYTPTEAGAELARVAEAAAAQFDGLAGRIRGQSEAVTGRLVVTALADVTDMIAPALVRFQCDYPETRVELIADDRLLRLEYGEAHVAVRAGQPHETPDNIVRPLGDVVVGLCAHRDYIARMGRPRTEADFAAHRFVGYSGAGPRAPFAQWFRAHVPEDAVAHVVSRPAAVEALVGAGAGIGFLSLFKAARIPGIEVVLPPRAEWSARLWRLTHVDLHRTAKVQAFLRILEEEARRWPVI